MENSKRVYRYGFSTRAIHEGNDSEKTEGHSIIPPIVTSAIFAQTAPDGPKTYTYSRRGNPSRDGLEKCLASLAGGKYALTFSSGCGAMTTIMSLLDHGDHVVACKDIYGGTQSLFGIFLKKSGIECTFVNMDDLAFLDKAITSKTKMVWLETPSNPLMKVIDIKGVADHLKKHSQVMIVVDNTFLTPYFQRPLELGAHISMHSMSKYLNGHDDVIMGAAITNREDIYDKLKFLQRGLGIVPSPFDCYLVNRGLKTLPLRMKQHMASATEIMKYLEKHPMVQSVLHPSLPSHPQYELNKRQTCGHSGILSFFIKGDIRQSKMFLKSLKLVTICGSLGGPHTLAAIPAMTHIDISPEERAELGLSDNLIRLSVGLEDAKDLIEDITQALDAITM